MLKKNLTVGSRSGIPRPRQRESPARAHRLLVSFFIAISLTAFSLAASPGEGQFGTFVSGAASADGGHGKGSSSEMRTPTPVTADHSAETDAQHDQDIKGTLGTEEAHDTGSEVSQEPQETAGQEPHGQQLADTPDDEGANDGHENTGSETTSAGDDHDKSAPKSAPDDHGSAGPEESESHPHGDEAEGPSELARILTLGGFAGINGSVLLAAAILKKKAPKKGRNRAAAHGTSPAPETSTAPVAAPITLSLEPAPLANSIDAAEMSATEGEDIA